MNPSDQENPDNTPDTEQVDVGRRDFLKVAMTASALLAFGGVGTVLKAISNPAAPGVNSLTFPRVKVADISIAVNSPVYFNYPLDSEPNFLVKLGQKAAGGAGPEADIVAFSEICQHLGCPVRFETSSSYTNGQVGHCHCHGSFFDLLQSARVAYGPSPRPLPQVQLEVDSSGNIFAKGMGPPTIFGHNTGSNDVNSDLQGGNLVG